MASQKSYYELTIDSVNMLSEDTARDAIADLNQQIASHDIAYHQKDAPVISDAEYDTLVKLSLAIENAFPNLISQKNSSMRIGSAPSEQFAKVKHARPMLSLSNIFDPEEVGLFIQRINRFLNLSEDEAVEFTAEPKIDGLSISLRYEKGRLRIN